MSADPDNPFSPALPGAPVIYDSTLRDGAQALGITFSQAGKIRFAHLLDQFGIPYIEGGYAGSNERDMQFFRDAEKEHFEQIRIVAFGSTRRVGSKAAEDSGLQALLRAGTSSVAIYGKASRLHVREVLRTTDAENLDMISESVAFLREHGLEVHFDAEHFFDGYREDPAYALEVLRRAAEAGAASLVFCDTNGGTLPRTLSTIVARVHETFPEMLLGIHPHNDSGMGVANAIEGYLSGACMIQGCFNGYGERTGNANLTTIIPTLQLKLGATVTTPEKLTTLRTLSRAVDDLVNQSPDPRAPYVGEAAFAHKAGAHVSGIRHCPASFEHCPPEAVGNQRKVLLSELSGASNVLYRLKQAGSEFNPDALSKDEVRHIVTSLKDREAAGYSFESADASFQILVQKALGAHKPFFELDSFRVTIERRGTDSQCLSEATVKLRVNGQTQLSVGEGVGPVDALDSALRTALTKFYPEIADIKLTDFRVRILDPKEAVNATTRVLIESTDGATRWSTVGVSPNIIEASWQAILDSIEYKLLPRANDAQAAPSAPSAQPEG